LALEDEVICWVNNDVISKREVEDQMGPVMEEYHRRDRIGRLDEEFQRNKYLPKFQEVLVERIKAMLKLQAAKELKLEIDREIFEKEFRAREERYNKVRAQMAAYGQKPPLTLKEIREETERQFLVQAFERHLFNFLDLPTQKDVLEYYKAHPEEFQRKPSVKVRRFVMNVYQKDRLGREVVRDDIKALAAQWRREVAELGGEFADIAKEHSEDEEKIKAQGGLIRGPDGDEFIDPEQDPQMAEQLARLKPGEVSEVFLKDRRFYVFLKLDARREAGLAPFDHLLHQKISEILQKKTAKAREDEWFRKAVKKAMLLNSNQEPIPESFFFHEEKPAGKTAPSGK
jgi:parvulin-like peptidyl-prolyl isomerase